MTTRTHLMHPLEVGSEVVLDRVEVTNQLRLLKQKGVMPLSQYELITYHSIPTQGTVEGWRYCYELGYHLYDIAVHVDPLDPWASEEDKALGHKIFRIKQQHIINTVRPT